MSKQADTLDIVTTSEVAGLFTATDEKRNASKAAIERLKDVLASTSTPTDLINVLTTLAENKVITTHLAITTAVRFAAYGKPSTLRWLDGRLETPTLTFPTRANSNNRGRGRGRGRGFNSNNNNNMQLHGFSHP